MRHTGIDEQPPGAVTPAPIVEDDLKRERDLEEASTSAEFDEPIVDDLNVVNWDGPDDPANPQNWSMMKKTVTVMIVSSITFVT